MAQSNVRSATGVAHYVLELRKVLGDDAGNARFIETVPKRGYRFIAPLDDTSYSLTGFEQRGWGAPALRAGRTLAELSEFHRAMTEVVVQGERRRCSSLPGEVGIGKTSLVDAFCRQIVASITM